VNRFIKIFTLLIISLFVVVSGVDAALDHLSRSPVQSMFTVYNQQGSIVLAYNGDLSGCKAYAKPEPIVVPSFLHRT
jgi:hypothetical protein